MIILLFIMISQPRTTSVKISSLQEEDYACRQEQLVPSNEVMKAIFTTDLFLFEVKPRLNGFRAMLRCFPRLGIALFLSFSVLFYYSCSVVVMIVMLMIFV